MANERKALIAMLQRIEKKIDKLDSQSNLDKDYLSTREACAYLSCSRTMLWKLVKAGKLNKCLLDNNRSIYYSAIELKGLIQRPELTQA